MAGPLEGIRVLDWTQWQLGPVATMMMADLGAEVIHIEHRVKGDSGRGMMRPDGLPALPYGKSSYFECNNRGKKSITLDLAKEKGKEVLYRLVRNSDVFVHNFRQDVPGRLRLDYETLSQYNPKLIYATASGYGTRGPEANEPSFDYVGQARSGIMTMMSEDPNIPPLIIFGGISDQIGGIMTSYGILAGLLARDRLGVGQKVDMSHLGSMMALQGLAIGLMLYTGQEWLKPDRKRRLNPLWNHYQCKDGKWLMLAMLQSDRYWPTICKALGIEHLERDPRFENADKRGEHCEELIANMDEIFITKSASEWMKILKETGDTICTPVQSHSDLINDPQVLANEYIIDCNHEVLGPVKVLGIPVKFSKTPGEVKCEAPEFGQHTEEVLIEIGGYSWEDIARLREEEII